MDVSESALDAVVVISKLLVIEAEEVEERGMKIVRRCDVLAGFEPKLIGGAVAGSAFHPGTGKPSGEAVGIVVAPIGAGLKHWHAAKLSGEDNQRVVEQAALFQVAQQPGDRLVEDLAVHVVLLLQP